MSKTTIAFTSCFDAVDHPTQEVWDRIGEKNPKALLLLGDSVYMDYGIWPISSRRLGWPRKISNQEFAETLHQRYAKQWGVESFRRLICSGLKVGMTWDDHDFAWNNSRGAGNEKKYAVSREKRLISRGLFLQFKQVLRDGVVKDDYPPSPSLVDLLRTEDAGIQEAFEVDGVRIIMLDGRSFREDPNEGNPDADLHGRAQLAWLQNQLESWAGPKVIGSGSVLTESKESWDNFMDYHWLLTQQVEKLVVVSGDIHKNVPPILHRKNKPLYEVTSSGAAEPGPLGGGNSGNFGVLTLGDNNQVELFSADDAHGKSYPLTW